MQEFKLEKMPPKESKKEDNSLQKSNRKIEEVFETKEKKKREKPDIVKEDDE